MTPNTDTFSSQTDCAYCSDGHMSWIIIFRYLRFVAVLKGIPAYRPILRSLGNVLYALYAFLISMLGTLNVFALLGSALFGDMIRLYADEKDMECFCNPKWHTLDEYQGYDCTKPLYIPFLHHFKIEANERDQFCLYDTPAEFFASSIWKEDLQNTMCFRYYTNDTFAYDAGERLSEKSETTKRCQQP